MKSLNNLIWLCCAVICIAASNHLVLLTSAADLPASNKERCGSLKFTYQSCKKDNKTTTQSCDEVVSVPVEESEDSLEKGQQQFANVTNIISVETSEKCLVTLCDEENLMGYCAYFLPESTTEQKQFHNTLREQSPFISVQCSCRNNLTRSEEVKDPHFDRNYVGVVYSPYDKYWEPTGPNGTLKRVSWLDYSLDEIKNTLQTISTKFSYIATFGMGTATNTSKWYEGDKVAFVPILASELNAKYGYPRLRVAIGVFRKDDVHFVWPQKELFNAIEAAKVANAEFNGTVWGITVTSDYVTDTIKAREAIDMIKTVKRINIRDQLHLKVGIRIGECDEFIANRRPEDDADRAYQQTAENAVIPLTAFQASLHEIANITDYILCSMFPSSNYAQLPIDSIVNMMKSQFLLLRKTLRVINPNLKLIVETGLPSYGVGNGFKNTMGNLRKYWYSMAEFAQKEQIMFHMFEAVDQPWKNIQDGALHQRFDINGPNGTDAHYGWWTRTNNSEPPVYTEKSEEDDPEPDNPRKSWFAGIPFITKLLLLGFAGFLLSTLVSIACLCWKLRKAKSEVIGRAYVAQFLSGGNDCSVTDADYAVALRIPYNRKYELSKDSFEIDKKAVVGSGQCGVVMRGTVKGKPVAFKCTTPNSTVVDVKTIMSEIKILSFIGQHDNLVCILGAYTKKIQRGIVYIALEYCALGNLEKFLRQVDSRNMFSYRNSLKEEEEQTLKYVTLGDEDGFLRAINPSYVSSLDEIRSPYLSVSESIHSAYLSPGQLDLIDGLTDSKPIPIVNKESYNVEEITFLRWAYQIASAMEFVAEKNVIHADLAARNILMASLDQVKVSDFGLSRKLYQDIGVVHDKDTPLPWRWMSPESLKHLVFSVETDVWAYAVTIWEIFSLAEVPYHGISYDMQFVQDLGKGMRLPKAKHATPHIHELLLKCWDESPNNRPTFSQLKEFFNNLSLGYIG